MKTKSVLLSGVLFLALASAQAQTNPVYSVNVVGYTKLSLPAGFSMIANSLNSTNTTIGALIPSFPNFGNLYKWTGSGFNIATFAFGAWDKPNITLAPGEGCFVQPGVVTNIVFAGEVLQGLLTNAIPAGFSIQSSKVPQAGGVDALGLTPSNFDNLYKFNGVGYDIYTYVFGTWQRGATPAVPQVGVGESFFYNAGAPITWVRNFTVN
ncbi:MAG TPA: hypothetical protein VI454_01785 [Verrucomicrobiae bacterium]|jgi:hypothetical protein